MNSYTSQDTNAESTYTNATTTDRSKVSIKLLRLALFLSATLVFAYLLTANRLAVNSHDTSACGCGR